MSRNLTIADLLKNSMQTAPIVRKNITDFEMYGFSAADVDQLESDVANFKTMLPDEHYNNLFRTSVLLTEESQARILKHLRTLGFVLKIERRKGFSSVDKLTFSKYAKFKVADLTKNVSELVNYLEQNPTFTSVLPKISKIIDLIKAEYLVLEAESNKNSTLREARTNATQEREALLDSIYTQFAQLCNTGKHMYKYTNTSLYNQFVITSGIKSKPETDELEDDLIEEVA
ncbi:MAG TPA: hypothetical protein DCQ31_03230 [Bacteroidales bacterium]|nr:hypothetical protein [Bacteroidales bacterium]